MTMNDPFSKLAAQTPRPSDSVLAALRQEFENAPAEKVSLTRAQRAVYSTVALCVGLFLTTLTAVFRAPQTVLVAAAVLSASVGALLLAGAVPGERHSMGRSWRRSLVGGLTIGALVALALKAESFAPFAEFLGDESLHRAGACVAHSLMSGVVGGAALLFLWRRTDPFSPGLTGSLLALFGGLVGTTSVTLICQSTEGLHLTVGHGAGLLILTLVGFFAGRKWLSP